jgi:hypothetical protein
MPRGRRSAAGLQVVPAVPAHHRSTPPPDLSEPEAEAWRAIVSGMPATWFRGSETVLRRYVAEAVLCGQIEARLRAMLGGSGPIDQTLMGAHAKATATLLKLAQSLRLTPGSRATPKRAGQMLNDAKIPGDEPA